jgi:preprotein translocase SecE subunit
MFDNVLKYFNGVVDECRKITFSARKDVCITSIYIGVIIILTATVVTLVDFLISHLIRLIFGIGS